MLANDSLFWQMFKSQGGPWIVWKGQMEWLMTGGSLHLERTLHPDFDTGRGGGAAIFPTYTVLVYVRWNVWVRVPVDVAL